MREGVDGVTGNVSLAMDGATARPDGIDMSGRHPTAENDGRVTRIKGGGNYTQTCIVQRKSTCKSSITCQICSCS